MASSEKSKIENAAKLTLIFKNISAGKYTNIFDEKQEINFKPKGVQLKELISYYENYFKDNVIDAHPSEKEETEKYIKLAYSFAQMSLDKDGKRYISPISSKIILLKSVNDFEDSFKNYIHTVISNAIKNTKSLKALTKLNIKKWENTIKNIYETATKELIPKPEPTNVKEEPIEPNHVVSAENNNEEMEMSFESAKNGQNSLRQTFTKTVPMQIKNYDVIRMRDYLRILRRLWTLSQLYDGKEREIVTFDENRKMKNHPYFRTHPNKMQIYERINNSLMKSIF